VRVLVSTSCTAALTVCLRLVVQVLFCRYNDPSYVKLEKLEIMVKLASAQNIDQASMVPYNGVDAPFLPSRAVKWITEKPAAAV
jgi:hypothetical protein